MPGKFSRAGGKAALGIIPLNTFLMLCTTAPTVDAPGGEYTAVGYARRPVTRTAPSDTDPPVIVNTAGVVFGPFSDDTGDEIGWVVMTSAESGGSPNQYIAFWELDDPRTPERGDALVLDASALVLHCS